MAAVLRPACHRPDRGDLGAAVTLIWCRAGSDAAPALSLDQRMTRREGVISMMQNFDTTSDAADVIDLAWAEMDEFFKALRARGPASTPEQWEQDRARFLEIQARCNSLVVAISERAESGNPHN
jgi:hypothetical protein